MVQTSWNLKSNFRKETETLKETEAEMKMNQKNSIANQKILPYEQTGSWIKQKTDDQDSKIKQKNKYGISEEYEKFFYKGNHKEEYINVSQDEKAKHSMTKDYIFNKIILP